MGLGDLTSCTANSLLLGLKEICQSPGDSDTIIRSGDTHEEWRCLGQLPLGLD